MKKQDFFYFDAEWVPVVQDLFDLQMDYPLLYTAFMNQVEKWEMQEEKTPEDWWREKAHTYPEFCKIICFSYGYWKDGQPQIYSSYGSDEKKLLSSIPALMKKVEAIGLIPCGYAIKRFDMPWLSKRMFANGIKPPSSFFHYGKKPWEVQAFDLPEVWGAGTMGESYTPFEVACAALGIQGSKGDLSGPKVKEAYWNGEMERIRDYCELDVKKTMELAETLIKILES